MATNRHLRRAIVTACLLALSACAGTGGGDQVVAEPTPAAGEAAAVEGTFEPLEGRPAGYDDVAGSASVTIEDGTAATVEVTGLKAGRAYVAHVHEQPCSQDAGGAHFKFDPEGSDTPPNEVHFRLEADDAGAARAEATNEQDLPIDQALSVVVHELPEGGHAEMDGHQPKIACADLS